MKFITMAQLQAKLGGCGRTTVYRYVGDGILPNPTKLGGRLYWVEAEIEDAFQAQRRAA